jgi:D-alanyl-D-alanine carboxypeptidase (penicillin-binding protein 5/6)
MVKDYYSFNRKIKKLITIFLLVIFTFLVFHINSKLDIVIGQEKYPLYTETGYLSISAKSAILIDADSGRVLWEKYPHRKQSPASITKIMTAILAIENGDFKDKVVISEEATLVGESEVWLEENEVITIENLVYSALLFSANDACYAIAECIGGSVEKFVKMMNEKVKEIGLSNTKFVNPHGLDNEDNGYGNISTAYDIAQIARYCMKNPVFAKIVNTRMKVMPGPPSSDEKRYVTNRNKFLNKYEYANGIKTGYTIRAGLCLVASAKKDGINLIGVVLDSEPGYRDQDMINLFEYGFSNYKKIDVGIKNPFPNIIIEKDRYYKEVEVNPIDSINALLKNEEEKNLQTVAKIYERVDLPIKSGEEIGKIIISIGDNEIDEVNISSLKNVDIKYNQDCISKIITSICKDYYKFLTIFLLCILVLLSFKRALTIKNKKYLRKK